MNKMNATIRTLQSLNLSTQEAIIYLELLKKPATHAQLSITTGINRTTLYRYVSVLEKRSLIVRRLDDSGNFLAAADPSTLEAEVVTQEENVKQQRDALGQLLPTLETIKKGYEADFALLTYEGTEGFKRMLWHELKTKGDCLCIGIGALENLVPDRRWTEKHRALTVEAGYVVREITNPDASDAFTANSAFLNKHYRSKTIPYQVLPLHHLITVYNDTVATYNLYEGRRMGLEIISKTYARTMRSIFEQYWQIATDPSRAYVH